MEIGTSTISTKDYLRLLEIEKKYIHLQNCNSIIIQTSKADMWSCPEIFMATSLDESFAKIKEAQEKSDKIKEQRYNKLWQDYLDVINQSIWSFIKKKLF